MKPLSNLYCNNLLTVVKGSIKLSYISCILSKITPCSKFGQIGRICGVLINGCWQFFCPPALQPSLGKKKKKRKNAQHLNLI